MTILVTTFEDCDCMRQYFNRITMLWNKPLVKNHFATIFLDSYDLHALHIAPFGSTSSFFYCGVRNEVHIKFVINKSHIKLARPSPMMQYIFRSLHVHIHELDWSLL